MRQTDCSFSRGRCLVSFRYSEKNDTTSGALTHLEASYCVEIAQECALRTRHNVWVDGSLKDSDWYQLVFAKIRKEHPEYQIGIVHVYADKEIVFERVLSRAKVRVTCTGGRAATPSVSSRARLRGD